jgi:hypothetical protein
MRQHGGGLGSAHKLLLFNHHLLISTPAPLEIVSMQ